jgi:hypothetical protein
MSEDLKPLAPALTELTVPELAFLGRVNLDEARDRMRELHASEGSLVIGALDEHAVGDLLPASGFGLWMSENAWHVLGVGTSAEYHAQTLHCCGLDYETANDWPYFYRCRAAD